MAPYNIFICIAFALCFLLCFKFSDAHISIPEYDTKIKSCDDRGTFKHIIGWTLEKCAEECFRRQRCKWLMYRHGMNYCALKDFVNVTELDERQPRCLYISVDQWEVGYPDLGPCNNHTCGNDSRCTNTTENDYICEKSECLPPDEIDHAVILSNTHAIGTTNRYRCNTGYRGVGSASITCDSNATWSTTDFICKLRVTCPKPSTSYSNGDLTSVDGIGFKPGTVLHFTCRQGYQGTGLTATSTCQEDGAWLPATVGCCNDNSTDYKHWRCHRIVDAEIASDDIEVDTHCKELGGYWTWFEWEMAQQVLNVTSSYAMTSAIQPLFKSDYITYGKYMDCAADNGVIGNVSKDIDARLREAHENNWTGENCWILLDWITGQPDGGDNEDCIFYDFSSYYDDTCAFGLKQIGFVCAFTLPSL
ncbi:hypothetical protein ACF0H5_001761 [Mactra antiquata]